MVAQGQHQVAAIRRGVRRLDHHVPDARWCSLDGGGEQQVPRELPADQLWYEHQVYCGRVVLVVCPQQRVPVVLVHSGAPHQYVERAVILVHLCLLFVIIKVYVGGEHYRLGVRLVSHMRFRVGRPHTGCSEHPGSLSPTPRPLGKANYVALYQVLSTRSRSVMSRPTQTLISDSRLGIVTPDSHSEIEDCFTPVLEASSSCETP